MHPLILFVIKNRRLLYSQPFLYPAAAVRKGRIRRRRVPFVLTRVNLAESQTQRRVNERDRFLHARSIEHRSGAVSQVRACPRKLNTARWTSEQ